MNGISASQKLMKHFLLHRNNYSKFFIRTCYNFREDYQKLNNERMNISRMDRKKISKPGSSYITKTALQNNKINNISQLKSMSNIQEVLQYVQNNHLDPDMYADVFLTLYQLEKSGQSHIPREKLFKLPEIETISRAVNKNITMLNMADCINILKCLIYFGVPSNSILVQSFLQYIGKQINSLSIIQVTFLHFLLRFCKPSPLVDVLSSSLPLVFETNLKTHIDHENPREVTDAFVYALHNINVSNDAKKMIIDSAHNIADVFNKYQLQRLLSTLLYRHNTILEAFSLYSCLINIATKKIIHFKNEEVLINILSRMIDRYIYSMADYLHEPFLQGVISLVIERKTNFETTIELLKELNKISYYSPELLDYMDEQVKNLDNVETMEEIFSFIRACSNCTHKPKNWDLYESKLVSNIEKQKCNNPHWLARILVDLVYMKCWPEILIKYCLSSEYYKNLETGSFLDKLSFLQLYQAVKLFYPGGYQGSEPPTELIQDYVGLLIERKTYPLITSLQYAFGGSEFVLPGVCTKLGFLIDYLIVIGKDGCPRVVNPEKLVSSSKVLIESLEIPEDSYLVGVMLLEPSAFCTDGYRMRGKIRLLLQSIESCGIAVVPISHMEWIELEDFEKIAYLKEKVRLCIPKICNENEAINLNLNEQSVVHE